jgi:hypothetical protein
VKFNKVCGSPRALKRERRKREKERRQKAPGLVNSQLELGPFPPRSVLGHLSLLMPQIPVTMVTPAVHRTPRGRKSQMENILVSLLLGRMKFMGSGK